MSVLGDDMCRRFEAPEDAFSIRTFGLNFHVGSGATANSIQFIGKSHKIYRTNGKELPRSPDELRRPTVWPTQVGRLPYTSGSIQKDIEQSIT